MAARLPSVLDAGRSIVRWLWALLLLLCGLLLPELGLAQENTVRIGVLAFRTPEQTLKQWAPTAAYLEQAVPGVHFQIVPLAYKDFEPALRSQQLDFMLTNPEHYILMRTRFGLSAIATLMPRVQDRPVSSFGGVIAVPAKRTDLQTLEDLRGKVIAAPSPSSLGGYLAQMWELHLAGVVPKSFTFTDMPHDRAIQTALAGQADAAFVRTGVLEGMIAEKRLAADAIRVLQPQVVQSYPQQLSTALYPEWPIIATEKTPYDLKKTVTLALLSLDSGSDAARAGGVYGFAPPGDYAAVEAVMLRLRINPYRLEGFDWQDILLKYNTEIYGTTFIVLLTSFLLCLFLWRTNRRLSTAQAESRSLARQLEQKITELHDSNADLEQFAYVTSHDLREPLRVVSSYMTLLERRYGPQLAGDGLEFIAYARDGALRMNQLIEDLLQFSRVGRKDTPLVSLDTRRLIAEALHNLKSRIETSGARIQLPASLPTVTGAETDLIRLFQNLLGNAIKFHDGDGVPEISISCRPDGQQWCFAIKDNGIGIDPAYFDKIFMIFQRLNARQSYEGTGIGLAICKKIVDYHGGRLWVESQPGAGSTFFFTLPGGAVPCRPAAPPQPLAP